MKFCFFGTPDFSVIVLKELLGAGYVPSLVVTSSDKPVGRKQILTPSAVKQFAMKNRIPAVETHHDASLHQKQFDFGILVAYGKILPLEIINLFPLGILNIHPSLLPKYRGATPLQTAILNGDAETGVSVMKLNEKIDAGEIIAQVKAPILPTDTAQSLGEKLFSLGAKKLIEILPDYLEGKIVPQEQNLDKSFRRNEACLVPTTRKFTKQDGFIPLEDLHRALSGSKILSTQIDRKARAFYPWPGIWTTVRDNKRMIITKCHLENGVLKIDLVKVEGQRESPPPANFPM